MAKDLVPTNGGSLLDEKTVGAELASLREQGDLNALHEIAGQAAAYQEYARRQKAREEVNRFGEVQVFAEANIGLYDLGQPRPRRQVGKRQLRKALPLRFGDVEIPSGTRAQWRLLGWALAVNELNSVVHRVANNPNETLTSHAVYAELLQAGMGAIDGWPLYKRYQELHRSEGLTFLALCERAEVAQSTLSRMANRKAIQFPVAFRLAKMLGVELADLKSASSQRPARRRRNIPRQHKLVGGRLDESYSLIRKALQELDRATGQSNEWGTMEAWEHLYAAEAIVGKAMKRAV